MNCKTYCGNEALSLSWKTALIGASAGIVLTAYNSDHLLANVVAGVVHGIFGHLMGTCIGAGAGMAYGLAKWSICGAPTQNQKSIGYGKINESILMLTIPAYFKLNQMDSAYRSNEFWEKVNKRNNLIDECSNNELSEIMKRKNLYILSDLRGECPLRVSHFNCADKYPLPDYTPHLNPIVESIFDGLVQFLYPTSYIGPTAEKQFPSPTYCNDCPSV